ncbi:MAG: ABC transporter permease [Bryobacterales bacterium]|nr:ABC transporter permease [Bryobacterales bacterium]
MKVWQAHFRRELGRVLKDRRILLTMLGGPFLYAFLFGGVYWEGRIGEIPIVIVDEDHTALSREFSQALLANEALSLAFYGDSVADFHDAAKREAAYAAVVIPRGFESDVRAGRQGEIAVILDGSNVLIGNVVSRAIARTTATYRAMVQTGGFMSRGMPRAMAEAAALPIRPEVRVLFNPASHYSYFILVGLVLVALQQVTRMGAAISLSLDAEPGGQRELAEIGGSVGTVLSAKLAATAAAVLPISYAAIRVPFDLFGSPFGGSWFLALSLLTLFVLMQILIGYGISGICGSATFSLHVLLFASVPLFALAGFTWPAYAMPAWLETVNWLIPLTHIMSVFRKISLMVADISTLWPHLVMLLAWLPISVLWAYWGVKRQTSVR